MLGRVKREIYLAPSRFGSEKTAASVKNRVREFPKEFLARAGGRYMSHSCSTSTLGLLLWVRSQKPKDSRTCKGGGTRDVHGRWPSHTLCHQGPLIKFPTSRAFKAPVSLHPTPMPFPHPLPLDHLDHFLTSLPPVLPPLWPLLVQASSCLISA